MKQLGLVAAVAGFVTTAYFVFSFYAQAQTDSEEQVTIVQAVEKLTAIHVRQATVAEAEAKLIAEWCLAGKMADPTDCPVVLLPAVSAAAPEPE